MQQFRSPLIYILGIAAAVSVAIGEPTDAGFIAAVLGLNAVIGGYQEWRAEKSTQALQQLLQIRAAVMREGEVSEVDAEQVVPGDTVWLESGNRVPADMRLVSAHGLHLHSGSQRWRGIGGQARQPGTPHLSGGLGRDSHLLRWMH